MANSPWMNLLLAAVSLIVAVLAGQEIIEALA
jgi:hypothetical protein